MLYLPHLNGERSPFTDPTARGALVNLSPATTTGTMCRAVLEGVAYNYRTLSNSLGMDTTGVIDEPLPMVGGGARSKLWTSTIADVLRRPIAPTSDAASVAARGCAAGAFQVPAAVGRRRRGFATGRILPRRPGWFGRRGGDSKRRKRIRTRRENYAVWSKLHEALKNAGAGELVR